MHKFFGILFLLLSGLSLQAQEMRLPALELLMDAEVTQIFDALPVQEGGRIKPLQKLANTRLLALLARESLFLTKDGEMDGEPLADPITQKPLTKANGRNIKLTGTQWLLLSWFRPDLARTVPIFKVDNSAAVAELGLPTKGLRASYSYAEILPGRELLMKKLEEYKDIPARQQQPVQRNVIQLAKGFLDFEMILGHFDFIRSPVGSNESALPTSIPRPLRLSQSLSELLAALNTGGPPMQIPWFPDFYRSTLGSLMSGNPEAQLRLFPLSDKNNEVWSGPGDILFNALNGERQPTAEQLQWLATYENLYLALPDAGKFKAAAKSLLDQVQAKAKERNEGQYVELENRLIRSDYFFKAQWAFLAAFVFVMLSWVRPGSRLDWAMRLLAWLVLLYATYMVCAGITLRSLILQRPPISTLYDTMLFVSGACALFGLILELLSRRSIGLLLAAVLGGGCIFMSIQFDVAEATDNLVQLQAVLITKFWLSTHVPLVVLGYVACLVASGLAVLYLILRLVGKMRLGDDEARFITKSGYAFICAGLFFALVGTVLGGIWANYSWGRFWGWDPKENGALMIVLMCLVILHARLGGYIREIGLHCCNCVLGMVVVFSWFGVNQLGVGLHAYGFTDGVWPKIYLSWLLLFFFLCYGLFLSWQQSRSKKSAVNRPS
jgi:ABC-type transport system involved in cytochrome c biogenesis permease subunit